MAGGHLRNANGKHRPYSLGDSYFTFSDRFRSITVSIPPQDSNDTRCDTRGGHGSGYPVLKIDTVTTSREWQTA